MPKTSIAFAVSAYNEQANIVPFLESVLAQKQVNFTLEQVLVYVDGGSDQTSALAKSVKDSRIKVIQGRVRLGKSSRLNQIYAHVNEPILIQSDADVIFKSRLVFANLLAPMLNHKNVGMVGGNTMPLKAQTFLEHAVNTTAEAFNQIKIQINQGNCVYTVDGRLLAYKRQVYKQFNIPTDMIANDAYTYFATKSLGFDYKFARKAVVYFRSPQTLSDHIKQNTRFRAAPLRLTRHFDPNWIIREYHMPKILTYKFLISQVLKKPQASLFIFFINRYTILLARLKESKMTAIWSMVKTSKQLVTPKIS